tara:strand:+ start:867 stop:1076 length:210 start_codon:yes stop_codon:yes gene_type:complete
MDAGKRQKRVEGLEAIKDKALAMAAQGDTAGDVRNFVTSARKELAFELPDEDSFKKAVKATLKYKESKK